MAKKNRNRRRKKVMGQIHSSITWKKNVGDPNKSGSSGQKKGNK